MTQDPASPADACLHAALRAVAAARAALGEGVAALLTALLARLFAEHAAWATSQDDDEYDDCGFDRVAFRDPSRHARPIFQPQIGRAPHDIHVECGQVPGYVMAGVRNRGMRAIAAPARPIAHAFPARAPPTPPPPPRPR